jgi:hypothetical protein
MASARSCSSIGTAQQILQSFLTTGSLYDSVTDAEALLAKLTIDLREVVSAETASASTPAASGWRSFAALGIKHPLGALDVTFIETTFAIGLHPQVKPSDIVFAIEGGRSSSWTMYSIPVAPFAPP